jgi:MOSC domain-containing protein YiiM
MIEHPATAPAYPGSGTVVCVCRSPTHDFSKQRRSSICLVEGLGVEGDAHQGATVKHRSRVRVDPSRPNLRQVHLIHAELLDELAGRGFGVTPGDLGENITTRGLPLLDFPAGTRLAIGDSAIVELTGLRNPCGQIEDFMPGLLAAVLDRDATGRIVRKTGVMAIVVAGGEVGDGASIRVTLPPAPHRRMDVV